MLAKNEKTPRGIRPSASSLTSIASVLAPTVVNITTQRVPRWRNADGMK